MSKLITWPEQVDAHGNKPGTFHWCPGCETLHPLPHDRGWKRYGSDEYPTYTPSFKHTLSSKETVCHYFITKGYINFCPDSWHRLRGSVLMPEIPDHVLVDLTHYVVSDRGKIPK